MPPAGVTKFYQVPIGGLPATEWFHLEGGRREIKTVIVDNATDLNVSVFPGTRGVFGGAGPVPAVKAKQRAYPMFGVWAVTIAFGTTPSTTGGTIYVAIYSETAVAFGNG